eukprot:scaffold9285_cov40-Tisochrysis_lutea.AAC.2
MNASHACWGRCLIAKPKIDGHGDASTWRCYRAHFVMPPGWEVECLPCPNLTPPRPSQPQCCAVPRLIWSCEIDRGCK